MLFLVFIPIVASLVYLIARGKGMAARGMKRNEEMRAAQEDYIRSVATPSVGPASSVEQLSQAKALLDSGAITPEEFAAIKAVVCNDLCGGSLPLTVGTKSPNLAVIRPVSERAKTLDPN